MSERLCVLFYLYINIFLYNTLPLSPGREFQLEFQITLVIPSTPVESKGVNYPGQRLYLG